jgi:NodT family efflux transporter outer membrane factor (OMF) lipoprotein
MNRKYQVIRSHTLSMFVMPLVLSACAVGPDYKAPVIPTLAAGPFLSQDDATTSDRTPVSADWWKLYHDPVLDGLVQDALAANTDVRMAVARLARARAQLRETSADQRPTSDLGASANRQRQSAIQSSPEMGREHTVVDLGFSVAYEVDLFGRVRRNVEASRGDYQAAQAELDAVRVSTVAATTQAYLGAASAAHRLAVAQQIVKLLDRSVSVTASREQAGLTTSLDTARIAALRDQRRAEIPQIVTERQAELFRLALLTGRAPKDLPREAGALSAPPRILQPIPVGDGMSLLARRPDVRAAERRLAAETARIGVATSALYPQVSLGASVGSTGFGVGDFFGAGPLRWLAGPLVSWSFPNQALIRSRIDAANAQAQAALAAFDGTVLLALSETETALSNYARSLDRQVALAAARDQAQNVARIVRAQAREGRADSLALLDAERTYADAQAELAQSEARVVNAQVDLFKALGGGWQSGATDRVVSR